MKARVDWQECAEILLWGMGVMMRPTFNGLLEGYGGYKMRTQGRVVGRLRASGLVQHTGRGDQASFTITDQGRALVGAFNPRDHWAKPWDGRWRVFSFDVPEVRRTDRRALYWALRKRKLGLLQRSVWVWPHDVEAMLREMVEAEGIPECFVGFEAVRLFLCNHREVVESAWDFEAMGRYHERYLRESKGHRRLLARADSLPAVARQARHERLVYLAAFEYDPLLPRELWPKSYRGHDVQGRHEQFRAGLAERLRELAPRP